MGLAWAKETEDLAQTRSYLKAMSLSPLHSTSLLVVMDVQNHFGDHFDHHLPWNANDAESNSIKNTSQQHLLEIPTLPITVPTLWLLAKCHTILLRRKKCCSWLLPWKSNNNGL